MICQNLNVQHCTLDSTMAEEEIIELIYSYIKNKRIVVCESQNTTSLIYFIYLLNNVQGGGKTSLYPRICEHCFRIYSSCSTFGSHKRRCSRLAVTNSEGRPELAIANYGGPPELDVANSGGRPELAVAKPRRRLRFPRRCKGCDEVFVSQYRFQKHRMDSDCRKRGIERRVERFQKKQKLLMAIRPLLFPVIHKTERPVKPKKPVTSVPIKCQNCKRIYTQKTTFYSHIRNGICERNQGKGMTCSVCNVEFRTKTECIPHQKQCLASRISGVYFRTCEICKKDFGCSRTFLKHKKKYHSEEKPLETDDPVNMDHAYLNETAVEMVDAAFVDCKFCSKRFYSKKLFLMHRKKCLIKYKRGKIEQAEQQPVEKVDVSSVESRTTAEKLLSILNEDKCNSEHSHPIFSQNEVSAIERLVTKMMDASVDESIAIAYKIASVIKDTPNAPPVFTQNNLKTVKQYSITNMDDSPSKVKTIADENSSIVEKNNVVDNLNVVKQHSSTKMDVSLMETGTNDEHYSILEGLLHTNSRVVEQHSITNLDPSATKTRTNTDKSCSTLKGNNADNVIRVIKQQTIRKMDASLTKPRTHADKNYSLHERNNADTCQLDNTSQDHNKNYVKGVKQYSITKNGTIVTESKMIADKIISVLKTKDCLFFDTPSDYSQKPVNAIGQNPVLKMNDSVIKSGMIVDKNVSILKENNANTSQFQYASVVHNENDVYNGPLVSKDTGFKENYHVPHPRDVNVAKNIALETSNKTINFLDHSYAISETNYNPIEIMDYSEHTPKRKIIITDLIEIPGNSNLKYKLKYYVCPEEENRNDETKVSSVENNKKKRSEKSLDDSAALPLDKFPKSKPIEDSSPTQIQNRSIDQRLLNHTVKLTQNKAVKHSSDESVSGTIFSTDDWTVHLQHKRPAGRDTIVPKPASYKSSVEQPAVYQFSPENYQENSSKSVQNHSSTDIVHQNNATNSAPNQSSTDVVHSKNSFPESYNQSTSLVSEKNSSTKFVQDEPSLDCVMFPSSMYARITRSFSPEQIYDEPVEESPPNHCLEPSKYKPTKHPSASYHNENFTDQIFAKLTDSELLAGKSLKNQSSANVVYKKKSSVKSAQNQSSVNILHQKNNSTQSVQNQSLVDTVRQNRSTKQFESVSSADVVQEKNSSTNDTPQVLQSQKKEETVSTNTSKAVDSNNESLEVAAEEETNVNKRFDELSDLNQEIEDEILIIQDYSNEEFEQEDEPILKHILKTLKNVTSLYDSIKFKKTFPEPFEVELEPQKIKRRRNVPPKQLKLTFSKRVTSQDNLEETLFSVGPFQINMLHLKSIDYYISKFEQNSIRKTHKDFNNGWLYDVVIDAYLYLKCSKVKNVYVVDTAVSRVIESCGDQILPPQFIFQNFENVFIPCNPSGRHWILLIISPVRKVIEVIDPFGPSNTSILPRFVLTWQNLYVAAGIADDTWNIQYPEHVLQMDGHSCGVFVCWFVKQVLKKKPLTESFNEHLFRKEIYDTIVMDYYKKIDNTIINTRNNVGADLTSDGKTL